MSVGIALNLGHKYRKANPLAFDLPEHAGRTTIKRRGTHIHRKVCIIKGIHEFHDQSIANAMHSPFRMIVSLVLLALPLLEIALLIKAGQAFGFWPVVGTIIVTGLAGVRIIQTQGIATFRRISEALDGGREPHRELADGALRLLAGVLLLLPGPMTDALGVLLMVPPLRSLAADALFARATKYGTGTGRGHSGRSSGPSPDQHSPRHRPDRAGVDDAQVIEGEFERIDERTVPPERRPPARPSSQ